MCIRDRYEEFSKKPQAPTLQDLYRILQCQKEELAKDIVLASEIFTKGSLNTFAQPTNVQLDNRVLCFNIRDLGQQLRPIGTVSYTHLDVYKRQQTARARFCAPWAGCLKSRASRSRCWTL